MAYYVRKFNYWRDLPFCLRLFRNPETRALMFDGWRALLRFCFSGKFAGRYLCIRSLPQKEERVGMVNFSFGKPNEFWMSGALKEQYLNSGIGVYACIAFIDSFYKDNPGSVIWAGTFLNNTRCFKMLSKIGFRTILTDDTHRECYLTEDFFNNEFVTLLKQRYSINL